MGKFIVYVQIIVVLCSNQSVYGSQIFHPCQLPNYWVGYQTGYQAFFCYQVMAGYLLGMCQLLYTAVEVSCYI